MGKITMTEQEWHRLIRESKSELQKEFNEKIRASHKRINEATDRIEKATEKIEEVGKSIAAINAELKYRPDDGEVRDIIQDSLKTHLAMCKDETSRSPLHSATASNTPPSTDDKNTIKISISDLPKIWRWLIYALIPLLSTLGGYQLAGENISQQAPIVQKIEKQEKDIETRGKKEKNETDTDTARRIN